MVDYLRAVNEQLGALGARVRALRLIRKLGQDELSKRAGVGVMTVRRFERTGVISSENMLRIAIALQAEHAFDALFAPPPYASLDDLQQRPALTARQRAPRRK